MNHSRRVLKTIAIFEGLKGFLALLASLGYLSLVHHDIHRVALELIGHYGANPTDHYPALLISWVDQISRTSEVSILLLAFCYALVRFLEAFGIWFDRSWGEWLAAFSGVIYLPFELHHLFNRPSWTALGVFCANLLLIIYMISILYKKKFAISVAN